VSLSATDIIGHAYGPRSAESRDALLRLDAALGEFLDFLDARFGPGRVLVALTSDHGVLPLPEWLAETETASCPVDGGRQGIVWLGATLFLEMHLELSPLSWPESWVGIAGQLTIDRAQAAEEDVPVARAIGVLEHFLESQPSIREAWTAEEIRTRSGPIASLYRNSFDPERSGDVAIQLEPGCLIGETSGTTHGTPYPYDRDVPILFHGHGVAPGRVSGPAATVDIGPTLAGLLGVAVPPGLDGRDLLAADPPPQPRAAASPSVPARSRKTSGSM